MTRKKKNQKRFEDDLDELYQAMQSESAAEAFRRLMESPPRVKDDFVTGRIERHENSNTIKSKSSIDPKTTDNSND